MTTFENLGNEPRWYGAKDGGETWEQHQAACAAWRTAVKDARCKLAQEIAKALGAKVVRRNDEYEARWYSFAKDGREFTLYFSIDKGAHKYSVSGSWPSAKQADGQTRVITPRDVGAIKYGETAPEIGGSCNKGAERIARDIERRFLPAFAPIYDKCKEIAEQRTQGASDALAEARKLAKRVGGSDVKADGDGARFWIGGACGSVRVNVYGGKPSITLDLRSISVSPDAAVAILRALGGDESA
jgi:hypothetical protein